MIGFAICHLPPNSEAPHGAAYVKFLAVDARHQKPEHLHALLGAVEELVQCYAEVREVEVTV